MDAISLRQLCIQQNHIRLGQVQQARSLIGGTRVSDHFDIAVFPQNAQDSLSGQLMVIHKHHLDIALFAFGNVYRAAR